jgi:hypothetical protein
MDSNANSDSADPLAEAVELLGDWRLTNVRDQVRGVITRFELDPSYRYDVMAAAGYVWATYYIVPAIEMVYDAPMRDEASQAVMRCLMVHPDFLSIEDRDPNALTFISMAANGGLADHLQQTGAIPKGVDRWLQTGQGRLKVSAEPART